MMDVIFRSLIELEPKWRGSITQADFERWLLFRFRSLHDDGECASILCPYCAFDEYQTVKEKK